MPQVDFITFFNIIFWFCFILFFGFVFFNLNVLALLLFQKKNLTIIESFTMLFNFKKNLIFKNSIFENKINIKKCF